MGATRRTARAAAARTTAASSTTVHSTAARLTATGCAALTLGVLTLGLAAPATAATEPTAATASIAVAPATTTATTNVGAAVTTASTTVATTAPAPAPAPDTDTDTDTDTDETTPVSVPIGFSAIADSDGRFYPTVDILLGTNPEPYTVILDTGSTALVMFHEEIPGATTTDAPAKVQYVGSGTSGTIATADFSIGGQTASDVNFLAGDCTATSCLLGGIAFDGILGIGQALQEQQSASSPATYPWYSPLRQFDDSALSAGYSLGFTEENNVMTSGTLTLGAPSVTASTPGVTAIQAALDSGSYPNALGSPVYQKAVPLCWSVEEVAPLCQATTIDSGAPVAMLTGSQFSSLSTDLVADQSGLDPETVIGTIGDGDSLSFSATAGGSSIASWVATRGIHRVEIYDSIPDKHLNTGNAFFIGRTLSYDAATGQILVQAGAPAPASPVVAATAAGSGTVTALWSDPEPTTATAAGTAAHPAGPTTAIAAASAAADSGTATTTSTLAATAAAASVRPAEALTDRLVRVKDAAGHTIRRFNLPGEATTTTITGLVDGQTYSVEIASANHRGVSDYAAAAVTLAARNTAAPADSAGPTGTRLADTGVTASSPVLTALSSPVALGLVAASILAGALLSNATRRRRRDT